jgi:signal transduction histidine kinase
MEPNDLAVIVTIGINGIIFLVAVYFILKATRRSSRSNSQISKLQNRIEQQLLKELLSAGTKSHSPDETIETIGNKLAEVIGYSRWMIWLFDKATDGLVLAAAELDNPGEKPSILHGQDKSLLSWSKNNLEPVFLNAGSRSEPASDSLSKARTYFAHSIYLPLVDGEEYVGFILTGGDSKPKSQRSFQFLDLFGAISASLIRKAYLVEEENKLRTGRYRDRYLANLGQLAAGLAHEIRNPLTLIKSTTQFLVDQKSIVAKDIDMADDIIEEIERINHKIENLLTLGKIAPQQFSSVDLNEVLENSVNFISARAKAARIDVKLNLLPTPIHGSEYLLRQLVTNLLINSIEAIDNDGSITIDSFIDLDSCGFELHDDGPGIPDETVENIFDPFYTTKESGTGLGLSICYNIAHSHGGSLEMLDSNRCGTTFKVKLPLPAFRDRETS